MKSWLESTFGNGKPYNKAEEQLFRNDYKLKDAIEKLSAIANKKTNWNRLFDCGYHHKIEDVDRQFVNIVVEKIRQHIYLVDGICDVTVTELPAGTEKPTLEHQKDGWGNFRSHSMFYLEWKLTKKGNTALKGMKLAYKSLYVYDFESYEASDDLTSKLIEEMLEADHLRPEIMDKLLLLPLSSVDNLRRSYIFDKLTRDVTSGVWVRR